MVQDLWPVWLDGDHDAECVDQQDSTVEFLEVFVGFPKSTSLSHRIVAKDIGPTCFGGKETGMFLQLDCQLVSRQAGQFPVALDDQFLRHLLVGQIGNQGHCTQDYRCGHKGPGDDLGT